MSVFHLSQRLLLMGSLAAALGAGAAPHPIKPIPVTQGANAGEITANLTLSKLGFDSNLGLDSAWELRGYTLVKAGATLTIEPGTTIQSHPTDKGVLMVDRGGYLIAAGTAEAPITFKGATDERGKWGGLVLLGKAFSNQNSGGSDVQYEALEWAAYSGADDNDSSGVLTYLRLINPGFPISVDRELNGLTLCAVGRRTVIHHIQVHRGDDDGVEWFGGTVNTSHLVVTNSVDDSYDTDHGYSGNSQYMIAIQSAEPPRPRENPALPKEGETVGDRGLECGSHPAGHNKYTNPVWSNITFIDNGRSGGAFEAKEECGGSYQKMVLVSGGITTDTSAWAMSFSSPKTVSGIVAPTPHIDFKKTYLTGKYKNKYEIISNNPDQIANATRILNLKIKALPFDEINSNGLYKDLTASHPQIAADSAGAIIGNDLWYQGWTLPNTVTFPKGDNKNSDPVITFTPPAYVEANTGFTLSATVTDADGIGLVEILDGTTVLKTSTTGSISHEVTGAAVGTHTYTLRVRDAHPYASTTTHNLNVVVSTANTAPTIVVTRTGNPTTLVAPASFILTATSNDPDGTALIEVLLNDVVVGSINGSQVSVPVIELSSGTHTYTVRARDAHAHTPRTATTEYTVTVDAVPNTAPVVNLIYSGGILRAPAAFTLTASALDGDGIASLKIFEGETELGSIAGTTLEVPIADKAVGEYFYRVEATDNHGTPKTSTKTITVTVVPQETAGNEDDPVVTLALVETDPLVAPATFTLLASATDANDIDTLQILMNGEVVETGTSLNLTRKFTGLAAGVHVFTARAKDKHATDPREGTKALSVTVNAPPANAGGPTVIFNRSGANTLQSGADINLSVVAEDPDGIDSLRIMKGTEVLKSGAFGSLTGSLSYTVEDLLPGTHTFTAWAKDKHSTGPMVMTQEITVTVESATRIAAPLRDLSGLSSFSARGQDLLVRSEGHGKVHFTVMSLTGRRVASRSVNLVQGQNFIPMGKLRGVHVVLVSQGANSRSTRVVFSAGK